MARADAIRRLRPLPVTQALPRFGIVSRVVLVLLLAFLAGVEGLLLVSSGYRQTSEGLSDISETHLPTLLHTAELSREVQRLVAFASDILMARIVLDEQFEQIRKVGENKDRLIDALRSTGTTDAEWKALERIFAALSRKLHELTELTKRQITNERRTVALSERLRRLHGRIGRLEPASDADAGCFARWQSEARQAIVELLAIRGDRNPGYLDRRQETFAKHMADARQAAHCVTSVTTSKLHRIDTELRTSDGISGLIDQHRRQITLRQALEVKSAQVHWLSGRLMAVVIQLNQRALTDAHRHSDEVENLVHEHMIVLTLIPALLLATVLGIYLYLNRTILRPVLQLRQAINDSLSSRKPNFPSVGQDEVGFIVAAVRDFIATLQLREQELRSAKMNAEQANRAKSLFLAHMSHELRTPLNTILGYADLIRRTSGLDQESYGRCSIIRRSGTHLLHLINDLLDVATIEVGGLKPVPGEVDLRGLLEEIEATGQREAYAKGLGFRSERGASLPAKIRADGRRIRQVLLNLLGNAIKYTESGEVVLRIFGAGKGPGFIRLRFTIEDTGPGIAPEAHARLFEPFEQLQSDQPGNGLGLAISHELATLLGGTLWLDSAPSRGSRFHFEIPVETMSSVAEPRPIAGYRGPRRRILIVDDEAENRRLLAEFLKPLDFAVATADSASVALKTAERTPPDLVLMDLVMPGWCGYAAMWALREQTACPNLPVIAVSTIAPASHADILKLGFAAFLAKPVEPSAVLNAIGHSLGLNWIFAREHIDYQGAGDNQRPRPQSARLQMDVGEEPLPPAQIDLETVLELVRMGVRDRVLEWCDDMAAGQPEYAPFAARVRALADPWEPDRLLAWLELFRRNRRSEGCVVNSTKITEKESITRLLDRS